ncbi:MAG: hypothetical protein DMG05_07000 [Acidobacteria bacterium]|nr:MAG: hypothetical protein DMG05_07000 [Acidobacteriota bacterium]
MILELRSVEENKGIHPAEQLVYLRLRGIQQGFLRNFDAEGVVVGPRSVVL